MRLENLFTVPEGEKITEKDIRRILAASICSILLCMMCLAGSTWAWFSVDIVNQANEIQIGTGDVKIMVGDQELAPGTELRGKTEVQIVRENGPDDLDNYSNLMVTLLISDNNGYRDIKTVVLDSKTNGVVYPVAPESETYTLNWITSWFMPHNSQIADGNVIGVLPGFELKPQQPTEDPTEEVTEEATETPTEEPTQAPTEAPTEAPTQTPTETPTEASSEEPTQESTEAVETLPSGQTPENTSP